MLKGSLVALVTPMHDDGRVDDDGLKKLVEFHIVNGTAAIVSVGTTGESATLDVAEHLDVIEATVRHAAGRIPVIAGTGANSTREAIELTVAAAARGAQMALSVAPYYNKPTQEGLYQHFKAIAEASPIPVLLYNVPGRTACDLSNDTALRLSSVPNIVGIKDATGDIGRAADLIKRARPDFALYSGDDATAAAFLLLGGHGVISVTANVAPKLMSAMCAAALAGDTRATRAANDPLQGLHKQLFIEANPIPAKWALQQMGLIGPGIRLPLTPLSAASQSAVRNALREAGIEV